jgi:hypothetical protein
MRILLFCHSFNSLTQRLHVELTERVPSRIVLKFADGSSGVMMLCDQAARSMV